MPTIARPARAARHRPSRAKPKPPRPRATVLSELRGLGGLVLEQALQDPDARPGRSMVAWTGHLAAELGCHAAAAPASYGALMRRIVEIKREAEANPGRPTQALPLAA